MFEFIKRYDVRELRKNKEKLYIFGDNLKHFGKLGQAIIRDEENAFGIPTKRYPSMKLNSFFTDKEDEIEIVKKSLDFIRNLSLRGRTIVLPSDGIGTGLALLKDKSPRIEKMINTFYNNLNEINKSIKDNKMDLNRVIPKKEYISFPGLLLFRRNKDKLSETLQFGLVDGRPRITIFLKPNNKILVVNIKLTYPALAILLGLMREAATLEKPNFKFTSFDQWDNNERLEDTIPIGSIDIRRNSHGFIVLYISGKNRDRENGIKDIDFPIGVEKRWHTVKNGDIDITNKGAIGNLSCIGMANFIEKVYSHHIYNNKNVVSK